MAALHPRAGARDRTLATLGLLGLLVLGGCASDDVVSVPELADVPTHYAGALAITPDPVRFDDARPGCTQTARLLLDHTGERALAVTSVALPNDALALASPPPLTLEPGARRPVELQFVPQQAGDFSGAIAFATDEGESEPLRVSVAAVATGPAGPAAEPDPPGPLDLVFVLDVSTTMDELAVLRAAIETLFDRIEEQGLDVRIGLTTFTNDVIVHRGGVDLGRQAFFEELDAQLVPDSWVPDPGLPRQLANFDFAENSLGALVSTATRFAFRAGARHVLLLMTDDTFLVSPATFSDGTSARFGYAEAAAALAARDLRLYAVHARAHGQGLSSSYAGSPSLVEASGGRWFEIARVGAGTLDLGRLLADLVADRVCH